MSCACCHTLHQEDAPSWTSLQTHFCLNWPGCVKKKATVPRTPSRFGCKKSSFWLTVLLSTRIVWLPYSLCLRCTIFHHCCFSRNMLLLIRYYVQVCECFNPPLPCSTSRMSPQVSGHLHLTFTDTLVGCVTHWEQNISLFSCRFLCQVVSEHKLLVDFASL